MGDTKRALEKLDDAYGKANDAEKAIIDFLRVWAQEDEALMCTPSTRLGARAGGD